MYSALINYSTVITYRSYLQILLNAHYKSLM